jgi:hypothetical protein
MNQVRHIAPTHAIPSQRVSARLMELGIPRDRRTLELMNSGHHRQRSWACEQSRTRAQEEEETLYDALYIGTES